jgi:hypothetical protein
MTLSPQDRKQVLSMAAAGVVQAIREELGDLTALVVIPLGAASQLLGLSSKQVSKKLPLTKTADGKHGITLANIRAHIEATTAAPISPLTSVQH